MALDKLKYTYQDPARVSELNVDNILNVNTTNATTVNSKAEVISPTTSNIGLIIKSADIANSDLQQFKNSSNIITSGVNAAGQMYIGGTSVALSSSGTVNLVLSVVSNGTTVTYQSNSGFTGNNPFFAGATVSISGFTGVTGYNGTFIIQSIGGISGVYTFTVANTATGVPGGSNPVAIQSPNLSVISQNPWNTPIAVRGANSQSADLQVWQNVNGTVLSRMNSAGSLTLLALHPARIQDGALTGAQLVPVSNTPNFLNSSGMSIRALGANQQALTVRSTLSAYTITSATANGTTITYTTTGDTQFIYVGMRATITNVVSTGNASATAGSGFNLVNATIASVTGQQFTVTNPLVDTYTSGGTATATTTADIQQWQNSAGTVLAYITGTGGAQFGSNINIAGAVLADQLANRDTSGTFLTMNGSAGNTINTGTARIRSRAATGLPLTIQSANTSGLITAATANGTTITYTSNVSSLIVAGQSVTILGIASTGNPGATAGSGFNLTNATVATASGTQFTVTDALVDTYTSGGSLTVAPTADLTQWQDQNGNIKAYINSAGAFVSNQLIGTAGYLYSVAPASFGSNGLNNTYQVQVINGTATRIAFMIKAAASQTGNLTEWQDSSGNVIALINSGAEFRGSGLVNLSSYQNSRFIAADAGPLINTNIVGNVGLRVQNTNVSATGDLQQWQNSGGSALAKVDISGNITAVKHITTGGTASQFVMGDGTLTTAQIPQNAQTSAYTAAATDVGKQIAITTGGVTINSSIFAVGDNFMIFNNSSSSQTITQGSGVTLRLSGTASFGNRTLSQYGLATVLCVASNVFVISGSGLA